MIVANEQRKVIYQQRNMLMETDDISEYVEFTRNEVLDATITRGIPLNSLEEQWNIPTLEQELESDFGVKLPLAEWLEKDDSLHEETLRKKIVDSVNDAVADKENKVGASGMRHFEKAVMLKVLDEQWKEHLFNMDHLRQGIHLRGYAQKNPKQEYKREAFEMFTVMLENVKFEVVSILMRFHIPSEAEIAEMEARRRQQQSMKFIHAEASGALAEPPAGDGNAVPPITGRAPATPRTDRRPAAISADQPFVRKTKKIGRNDPCPCGSGKKYKQCHGKL